VQYTDKAICMDLSLDKNWVDRATYQRILRFILISRQFILIECSKNGRHKRM
jgi:hypothetical protein